MSSTGRNARHGLGRAGATVGSAEPRLLVDALTHLQLRHESHTVHIESPLAYSHRPAAAPSCLAYAVQRSSRSASNFVAAAKELPPPVLSEDARIAKRVCVR